MYDSNLDSYTLGREQTREEEGSSCEMLYAPKYTKISEHNSKTNSKLENNSDLYIKV